ncbi:MAG: hypothetical protein ACXW1R_02080 [Halobacteriota archaeon]
MRELENEQVTRSDLDDVTKSVGDSEPAAYALLNALFDSVLVLNEGGAISLLTKQRHSGSVQPSLKRWGAGGKHHFE